MLGHPLHPPQGGQSTDWYLVYQAAWRPPLREDWWVIEYIPYYFPTFY